MELSKKKCMKRTREVDGNLIEGWKTYVLASFGSLLNDEESADTCISVGTRVIFTHRVVLKLNSNILEISEASHFSCGKLRIEILPEYAEHQQLVSDIIESFYTGSLHVNNENMRMVYKFAKCYCIQWLLEHTRAVIINSIEPNDYEYFCEIFKFGHTVFCKDLIEACLRELNFMQTDDATQLNLFRKLDFYCLKTIASSESILKVSELSIFKLLSHWCKSDLDRRACHIEPLLSQVQYCLIDKDSLTGSVFDWVVNISGIDEHTRLRLLIKVKDGIKNTWSIPTNRCRSYTLDKEIEQKSVLQRISDCLKNGDTSYNGNITPEELQDVIEHKFKLADNSTRMCILQYISKEKKITDTNINSFLKLYKISKYMVIIRLFWEYILCPESNKMHLIDWKDVTIETVYALVSASETTLSNNDFSNERFARLPLIIEVVMLWAQNNWTDSRNGKFRKLLDQAVCYDNLPAKYKNEIFQPYILKLFPTHQFAKYLICKHHSGNPRPPCSVSSTKPIGSLMYQFLVFNCPAQLLLLRDLNNDIKLGNMECCSLKCLPDKQFVVHHLKKEGTIPNTTQVEWTIYDAHGDLNHYPIFTRSISFEKLQKVTEKSITARIMLFHPLT